MPSGTMHANIGAVFQPTRLPVMVVTGLFLCASVAQSQQGGPTLGASAIKIRDRIKSLPPGEEVTALMKGRPAYHGDLREAGDSSFSLRASPASLTFCRNR